MSTEYRIKGCGMVLYAQIEHNWTLCFFNDMQSVKTTKEYFSTMLCQKYWTSLHLWFFNGMVLLRLGQLLGEVNCTQNFPRTGFIKKVQYHSRQKSPVLAFVDLFMWGYVKDFFCVHNIFVSHEEKHYASDWNVRKDVEKYELQN